MSDNSDVSGPLCLRSFYGIVIFFFRSAASGRMSATDTMTLTMTPSQERACLARRLSLSVLVESHRPRHDS